MSDSDDTGSKQPSTRAAVGQPAQRTCRVFKASFLHRGRPKGAKNRRTIVRAVAGERHNMVVNGKRRRRSTLELILLRLRNLALDAKNIRAIEVFQRLIETYQPEPADDNLGYAIAPADMTPEEWIEEQTKRNQTRRPPPGCRDGED